MYIYIHIYMYYLGRDPGHGGGAVSGRCASWASDEPLCLRGSKRFGGWALTSSWRDAIYVHMCIFICIYM